MNNETLYDKVPNDVYDLVRQYLSPQSKSALSQVDKRQHAISSQFARCICFLPSKEPSRASMYVDLLKRYSSIKMLSFESADYESGLSNEKQIQALVKFLNEDKGMHPMSHITFMSIQEVKLIEPLNPNDRIQLAKHKELNHSLLSALSHTNLQHIEWQSIWESTELTDQDILPILEKAIHLKHFKVKANSIINDTFNLSLENHLQLISATFEGCRVGMETLVSLNKSTSLKALSMPHCFDPHEDNWSIEHLILEKANNIKFIEKMPNLKSLTIHNLGSFPDSEELLNMIQCHLNLKTFKGPVELPDIINSK